MTPTPLGLDFYHDVVCGWCFVLSPRLHRIGQEFMIDLRHKTFVLQDTRERMEQVFGSMPAAKTEILSHWEQCRVAADDPSTINVEGMRAASFEYPNGWLAALACKAAEMQGGAIAHGRLFDALQGEHLTRNRNISDPEVLFQAATAIGLDRDRFRRDFTGMEVQTLVQADREQARALGIRSIPTLVVRETGQLLQNIGSLDQLRQMIRGLVTAA